MSWDLLRRFIESEHFTNDPFLTIAYLSRYADHIGIHHALSAKLRSFNYDDVEFFLPQLCHMLVSVDNMESMALEEFLVDLCEESAHCALLSFWLFQSHLHDLASNPQSHAFKTCRRIYNKVQHIVFGSGDIRRREKIYQNVLPVTVLAAVIIGSVGVPQLSTFAGPIAISQARRPILRSESRTELTQLAKTNDGPLDPPVKKERPASMQELPTTERSKDVGASKRSPRPRAMKAALENSLSDPRGASAPDIRLKMSPKHAPPSSPQRESAKATDMTRRHSHHGKPAPPNLSDAQKTKLLKANYFRCETQFLAALEDISNRLVQVPKPARLSALRAELALVNNDLSVEVDIPLLCPATLVDGLPSKSKHHRVVRINAAEATVLNSAEKVPYLLMIEVLREDFDFNPSNPNNETLLGKLQSGSRSQRRIFDLLDQSSSPTRETHQEPVLDSVFEPANGDLGNSQLLNDVDEARSGTASRQNMPQLSSSAKTFSTTSFGTPRTSEIMSRRSGSPSGRKKISLTIGGRATTVDQLDSSALATHMRTAAQMLAQLDASSSKRPREEVAAIKAKIIESMQELEEQSFDVDEPTHSTFDTLLDSNTKPDAEVWAQTSINPEAGAARMENDQKTGGLKVRGDRDDPSAATFGEEWAAKKERIRKSSPYGWMKNWDLLSIIVKTGADLRQEAFACQLIQGCEKIWAESEVLVWVKRMRILVTGESSGLVETITNGVSLHSIKRSLTLASIATGKNPRGRIATLKEHFVKTFGEPDTATYKAAAEAFVRSLAAYSMFCYVFQLKDRHNGNILIDNEGHIIHIDFGFMLSNSPGSMGFEAAPFKLTQDYVDVVGGVNGEFFELFKALCKQSFQALRKSADTLITFVSLMGHHSSMDCFASGTPQVLSSLRQRFQLHLSREEAESFVETELIGKSLGSYYTRLYDIYQYRREGIY